MSTPWQTSNLQMAVYLLNASLLLATKYAIPNYFLSLSLLSSDNLCNIIQMLLLDDSPALATDPEDSL